MQLAALRGPGSARESEADRARRIYHAKMLGHCLAPDRPEFRPVVTILIPVFNRAGPLVEAVEGCLARTWRLIEILVIDDGSTGDPAGALARFGSKVRLLRRAHGGIAGAQSRHQGSDRRSCSFPALAARLAAHQMARTRA